MTTLIDQHTAAITLAPIAVTLGVAKSLDVTLDESWSPYVQASARFPMPSAADRTAIDLRSADLIASVHLRRDFGRTWTLADLTAAGGRTVAGLTSILGGGALANLTHLLYDPWNGVELAGQTRDLSLTVIDRQFDDQAQELTIRLASLEAVLQRDRLVSVTPLDPSSTDLKTIVQSVLSRHAYTLSSDSLTATVAQAAATIWQPGVTAWDYLDSMLQAASLRLWCDELGVWRITARTYNVPGAVALSPVNMVRHVDHMTYDPDVWCDAVVVKYTWTDAANVPHTSWDVAGSTTPKSALLVELDNTIYPGPGAAAGILTRQQGRGRVLDIVALSDYTRSPGMPATIYPPNTSAQTGYLSAVAWHFPAGEMDVSPRNLADTPTDSFIYGPDSKTFATVAVSAPTLAINAFDWSLI